MIVSATTAAVVVVILNGLCASARHVHCYKRSTEIGTNGNSAMNECVCLHWKSGWRLLKHCATFRFCFVEKNMCEIESEKVHYGNDARYIHLYIVYSNIHSIHGEMQLLQLK